MLLSFSVENFHSFSERAEVSFRLTRRDTVHGWDRMSPSGARVTTAMAVMGANGAGKSNLIKAGPFLGWFIRDSFSDRPDAPLMFMQHQARPDEPSRFEFEADDEDGTVWSYVLHATPERVLQETLHRKGSEPGARPSYVFMRDWNGTGYEIKQQGFGLAPAEAAKVRANASLISWGKQYGAGLAVQLANFSLTSNLAMMGRTVSTQDALWQAAELFRHPGELQDQMRALLKSWDLGLSDVRMEEFTARSPQGTGTAEWFPMGVHRHAGREFELPFVFESSGTQTALVLLWQLLPALQHGGVAVVDELESDLHPHMIEPVLRLFHDKATNPHGAQIIFTCQSPEVLKLLQRAQVMFVEKIDCASTAYRGDGIEGLTSTHNLHAKYMAGALGAVPQI